MIQCVFNMLVYPHTGHPIFFRDKTYLPIGGPHQYPAIWDPRSGCISYMPRPGNPNRDTVSVFRVCLHIGDFPILCFYVKDFRKQRTYSAQVWLHCVLLIKIISVKWIKSNWFDFIHYTQIIFLSKNLIFLTIF